MNELNDTQNAQGTNDLLIGKGVHFKGVIKVPNRALINGEFDGELEARELIIESSGNLKGTTSSQNLIVRGSIDATAKCADLLSIGATGNVKGSVEYRELTIERGGKFEGTMKQRS